MNVNPLSVRATSTVQYVTGTEMSIVTFFLLSNKRKTPLFYAEFITGETQEPVWVCVQADNS